MSNDSLSEKVSVNINTTTLSNIDLLVDNGYYSNRSDFINQALREALQKHQTTLDRMIDEKTEKYKDRPDQWFVGISTLEKEEVEAAIKRGERISITGYGLLKIDDDIDDETLFMAVERIQMKGRTICRGTIKAHYGLK